MNGSSEPWRPQSSEDSIELKGVLSILKISESEYWRIIDSANDIALKHHGNSVKFERSMFFSWYCSIRDCKFCYMSTQPKENTRMARRTFESLYVEAFLSRILGWQFGFLSGGVGVYTPTEFKDLIRNVSAIVGEKIWINIGVLPMHMLKELSPYIEGVVGSVETVDKKLHAHICPSKPLEPVEKMYDESTSVGLKNAMTLIIGLGEKPSIIEELEAFIKKHSIVKIHIYGLNPQKGTIYEKSSPPSRYLQAWYVAKLRSAFPGLDIEAGVWEDRTSYIPLLLHAGATSLSKFPATRLFGKEQAFSFEGSVRDSGREFSGTLTEMPEADWASEIDKLPVDEDIKRMMKKKLPDYVEVMAGRKKLVRRAGKGQKHMRKVS